jgi:predicted dehydrogenase
MKIVRFGIIGVGGMGSGHAQYLNSVEGAKLTALCDVNPKIVSKYTAEYGVPGYSSHKELIASGNVDAVLIATPHYDHPPIAIDALGAGLHVLTEKPVAVSVGAARRLNEAAEKYPKLKFGAMFQMRTNSLYRKMREIIADGEIGSISRISWTVTDWFRGWAYYASGGWRATWAREGGGVLLNQCPHTLDLLQWIPGMMPKRITAVAAIAKRHPIEVEDEVSAILEYGNGAIGHFATSTGEAPGSNRLEVAGENGLLIAEGGKLHYRRLRKSTTTLLKGPDVWPKIEAWDSEIGHENRKETHKVITENFVRAVLNDEPLIAPGVEGARGLEIGNAMLMAGLTRRAVELPVDGDVYDGFLKELIGTHGGKKTLQAAEAPIPTDPRFVRTN